MKLFELRRDVDETGVSGTGTVAQGVIFDNGWCALTWLTDHTSVVFYTSIVEVVAIHGHDGKTRVVQIVDADPARWRGLVMNEYQDDIENVGVDFRSTNHREIWEERSKFARLFDEREFGKESDDE